MRKITFLILFILTSSAITYAQVFNQNYESLAIGATAADAGNQMERGSGTVQTATASGNNTKILKAVHNSGQDDMYVRSSNFSVTEGQVYNVSFDIATTNTVHVVTMRYANNDDFNTAQAYEPDTAATSTNGSQGGAPLGRMVTTANEFGTTSATFTVPAGYNTARLQIYNFGRANSLELDNFIIELDTSLSLEDKSKFNFKLYPNPAKNHLTVSASQNINNIEIYNVVGQQIKNSVLNTPQKHIDVSDLSKGLYLINIFIDDTVSTHKFIKD